ncbi:MAG TPA: hypothetical protein VI076_00500, partial [Actinopolymorphaceae bacterium]
LPAAAQDVPAFLGLNFRGNHACTTHPDVLSIADGDTSETGEIHYDGLRERIDVPPRRGEKAPRWPFELVNRRGCAVITLCYLQCGPDHAGIFERGIHPVMSTTRGDDRAAGEWGAIGIWAWTLSRVLDALQQSMVPEVAPSKVVAVGHSRLGKTVLWAAAQDERFAAVISNDSGCMGAALSRDVGETPLVLARIRPYWFAPRFAPPILAGGAPPVDQSALLACIAPRPLYVASASEDHNADPEGEFLSWREASRVWTLYGHQPVDAEFPSPGQDLVPAATPLGYHLRPGGHDVEPYDWQRWLDFCDRWVVGSGAQERTSSR